MRIFFLPNVSGGNSGPANADAALFSHWPKGCLATSSTKHGWKHAAEIVVKTLSSSCVVADGWGRATEFAQRIALIFSRRFVCINHGWLPFENEINELGYTPKEMKKCIDFMARCDVLVGVSKLQAHFVEQELPEMKGRIGYFFNGVEPRSPIDHRHTNHLVVAVSGGTRPIKRNEVVAKACNILASRGINVELRVYGRDYAGDSSWLSAPGLRYLGQVSQDEFLDGLAETDVFVMASLHESFGLSAVDALQAGASLLLSDACGVKDTLAVTDRDLVSSTASAEEIAENIELLWHYPNNARLVESIDYERYSWDAAAAKLCNICAGDLG